MVANCVLIFDWFVLCLLHYQNVFYLPMWKMVLAEARQMKTENFSWFHTGGMGIKKGGGIVFYSASLPYSIILTTISIIIVALCWRIIK